MSKENIIINLRQAIEKYDEDEAIQYAKLWLNKGLNPLEAIESGLVPGIRAIGEKFSIGEAFLPELMLAANIMRISLDVLEPAIPKGKSRKTLGKVVIGTVEGDIHDIGKSIVAVMLSANGFEVLDLGVDVPTSTFVEKVREINPDILALSVLMTTTKPIVKDVINTIKTAKLREKVKIMVGGAPTSKEWAKEIGADGYGGDAMEAVEVARKLIEVHKEDD